MAATASAPPVMSSAGAEAAEPEDSNISSPLSEVDDKDANEEDINMHLGQGDENDSSMTADGHAEADHDGSDSESVLSDARSLAHTDANDTEAETERLHDTPQHRRQRDVVVDQYNEGQIFEHSPSKLRTTAVVQAEKDHVDDESLADDAASSVSGKSEAGESTSKNATTKDTSVDDENHNESQDRKRKRSPATDNSETEQPLRKRTGSVGPVEGDQDGAANEADVTATIDLSAQTSVAEEEAVSPQKQEASAEGSPVERETRATRKVTRSGSRNKEILADTDEVLAAETPDEAQPTEGDEELEPQQETIEPEPEPEPEAEPEPEPEEETDAAAKSAEEAERKQAAFKDWSRIEEMFGVFRDRLYKDRLQRLEEEEQSLLADEPTHPEYLNMRKCLDDRLSRKLQEIEKENQLRLEANKRRFVAVRAQIWSQFAQGIREKRESTLATLNKEWYDVQTARRNAHSLPDYGVIFPKDPSQRIRNAFAYNTEVSTLAGMAKYEGFPAGPEIRGASTSELNDDLGAIEQARRSRHRPGAQAREEYQPPSFNRLGPAGEQFLKDTPWANPNHSAHKAHLQQALSGPVDGKTDSLAAAGRAPQPAAEASTTTAADGQISQQRSPAPSQRPSESPELTRPALKTGSAVKRTSLPSERESKTVAA